MGYPPGAENDSRAPYNERSDQNEYEHEYDKYDNLEETEREQDDSHKSIATTLSIVVLVFITAGAVGLFIVIHSFF